MAKSHGRPENLAEGLRSIRANTNIRVIWADAICINQQDHEEKSWQLQEIATIYKRAAYVISWLGRGTAESDLAFVALRKFNFGHDLLLSRLVGQERACNSVVAAIEYAEGSCTGIDIAKNREWEDLFGAVRYESGESTLVSKRRSTISNFDWVFWPSRPRQM
ncbi:hypothetical protein AYO20_06993 [Fonsecaea nubica]|uniref:Heterokaryon incompatibility domain-containing protein n=1 Tax=Fonsecaea nubica TaxID=856822 RepID=A0A178CXR4_9EURO|nr:hypothetical protein AYO20_06993 [Fonsecaea nubica]OAL33655.1 hypothetical protein AYO20_06993 [Fonsecaea nubica]